MCSRPNTAPAPLARARARCRGSPGLDPVQARPVWKVIGRARAMSCAPADGTMLTMNPHFVPLVRGRRLQITAYIVPGHGCVCMQSSSWGQSLPPQNGGGGGTAHRTAATTQHGLDALRLLGNCIITYVPPPRQQKPVWRESTMAPIPHLLLHVGLLPHAERGAPATGICFVFHL